MELSDEEKAKIDYEIKAKREDREKRTMSGFPLHLKLFCFLLLLFLY